MDTSKALGTVLLIGGVGIIGWALYNHFMENGGHEYTLVEGANYIIYEGEPIAATLYLSEVWDYIISAYYYTGEWYPITSTHAIQTGWHMGINVGAGAAGIVLLDTIPWEE